MSQFETEFYISGLAPLCDQLVVLSYVKEVSEKMVTVFLPNTQGWGAHSQRNPQVQLCQTHVLYAKCNFLTYEIRSAEIAL